MGFNSGFKGLNIPILEKSTVTYTSFKILNTYVRKRPHSF